MNRTISPPSNDSSIASTLMPPKAGKRSRLRRISFALTACWLAFVIALGILEIGLRLFADNPITATALNIFFEPNLQTGWHGIPNAKSRFRTISFDCVVEHDEEGFRKVVEPKIPLARNRKEIWMVGDSMTWGWGVNNGETFVDHLANADPSHRYRNFSAPGFSTLQESLLLRELLETKAPPEQLFLIFCNNDLSENVAYQDQDPPRPYWHVDGESAKMENYPVPPIGWFRPHAWMKAHSRAYNYLHFCAITLRQRFKAKEMATPGNMPEPLSGEQWVAARKSLNEIAQLCRSKGVRATVVCLPMDDSYDSHIPEGVLRTERAVSEKIKSYSVAAGMGFWDLQNDFYRALAANPADAPIRFRYDPHFTARGHKCIAEAIQNFQGPPAIIAGKDTVPKL